MTADRAARAERCPDGGYCHGSTFAVGSEPCPAGACFRVRNAGPLSGVYPGDRWPEAVRHEHGAETAHVAEERAADELTELTQELGLYGEPAPSCPDCGRVLPWDENGRCRRCGREQ